ncbi:protein translocase subunit SecA, chloroplastic isoform X1 [Cinnamomum micranthum f. kanehirae]|uniref:Protein translocase subunit SecA, chloroplastic isoform X1 n=1 Tax=Cinnamomum micranthum f. kanehirae TaxID=337451 RepID=A0A443PWN2_9MAGN|nr:protein translocase subunit SecA, chloroplastic isoform X1 [Cinnamomum micranthum f. kanehirae]
MLQILSSILSDLPFSVTLSLHINRSSQAKPIQKQKEEIGTEQHSYKNPSFPFGFCNQSVQNHRLHSILRARFPISAEMASLPFSSTPVAKNPPSSSPFSSRFLLLRSNFQPKFDLGHSYFGKEPRQFPDSGGKPSKLGVPRRRRLRPAAALGGLLGGFFKGTDTGEGTRQQYAGTVDLINGLEPEMSRLSDSELRERTSVLKERARKGESLDSLLPVAWFFTKEK